MTKTLVLNPFTLDPDDHSNAHGISFPEPSLTVQADVEQSDINFIVRQFGLTHELPYGLQVPEFTDFSDAPNDYHAAMNFIREADAGFMTMPADVRSRFQNDAGQFLDFVSSPDNYQDAIALGLVPPRVEDEPSASTETPPPVGKPEA